MNRRNFLTASLSSLAAMALPCTVTASYFIQDQTDVGGYTHLRTVFRLKDGRWVRCRLRDLVIGDRFRMEYENEMKHHDREILLVSKNPTRDPRAGFDRGWEVMASRISAMPIPPIV